MRVIGVRRHPHPAPHVEHVYGSEEILEALSQANVVMVVLPNTPHTRNFIGQREFKAMPKGVFFFNAGRGQTVNTEALTEAFSSGTVGGAGLDVVYPEPLPPGHPLWRMPNVIMTPHTSGAFSDYVEEAIKVFLNNLHRYLKNEPLQFVVDKKAGY